MIFVVTWIVSGWLSLDQGRVFSEGQVTPAEAEQIVGSPVWAAISASEPAQDLSHVREIEWFAFGGEIFRRERTEVSVQRLSLVEAVRSKESKFLTADEIDAVIGGLAAGCRHAAIIDPADDYAVEPRAPGAPVYRSVCGDTWYHVDGASGTILDKLDPSRRAYRWAYSALHTFDFPALVARPNLRTLLVVVLCAIGFVFSLTGIVIGWRRLRLQFY